MGGMQMPIGAAPPQPPDVMAQQGLGQVAARNMPPPNAHALLQSKADAVRTVLEGMAADDPGFAPYARAAVASITNGVSAVMSAPAPALPEQMPVGPPPMPPGPPLG